ncbi:MAG TPA: DMT family transporter [Candidatus Saccharimonadales bacterium]|nr:DMT family transporter [Candidatus Saccharimonadales bacterium]
MWLFYALLSGLLFTGEILITRHVLRSGKDAWAYSFYFSFIGAVISLPFMLVDPTIPRSISAWLLALVVGLLIVGNNLLAFKSNNILEVSLSGAINKFRLVWVFAFSILILGTPFSWMKLAGTILTVAAGIIIIHRFKRPQSNTGVVYALGSTVFIAAIIILYKYLLKSFNAPSMTFFATFLIPTIINFSTMPNSVERIKKIYKLDGKMVIIACALGAFANLALNKSLSLGEATSVLVISEVFLILTLVGEHVFLKEKEQVWIKFAAVILATSGAILIRISS